MIRKAAGPRRWMLWAAPLMALVGLRWGPGGAAAVLAFWIIWGPNPAYESYPYSRKRKPAYHRLLLGFAVCVFFLMMLHRTSRFFLSPQQLQEEEIRFLFWAGSIGFSLPLAQKTYELPLKRKPAYLIAGFMFFLSLFLFLSGSEALSIS